MTNKLTCLIAAYNEAPRIGSVLKALASHEYIHRVIVVDDASTDGTADVVREIVGVELIENAQNQGKTRSIIRGLEAVESAFVMLIDADLIGLTAADISALAHPIIEGEANVSISLRGNAPRPWHWIGIDYISGERVIPTAICKDHLEEMRALPKFGLEVFMNQKIIASGAQIRIVDWPNVSSPYKGAKHGWRAGIKGDIKMLGDIFSVISPIAALRQIQAMRKARV